MIERSSKLHVFLVIDILGTLQEYLEDKGFKSTVHPCSQQIYQEKKRKEKDIIQLAIQGMLK